MAKYLSLDEIETCLRAWRELGDENSFVLLFTSYTNLIASLARKYLGNGLTFDDLKSAGSEGLFNAINKFDYGENPIQAFYSYISISIERAMISELRKNNKHSHVLSLSAPIGQNKDGDDLKLEDILGTDAEELVENVILEMKIDIVREALKSLTSREQRIILLRYGLDDVHRKTQEEVAQIFGCSKATIAREEKRALIKMRHPRNTRKLKDFIND